MGTIAIRLRDLYAQTLLHMAGPPHAAAVLADMDAVQSLMGQEPDLGRVLTSPYVPARAKDGLLLRLLAGKVSDLSLDFVRTAVRHRRAGLLVAIIDKYRLLWQAQQGHCPVHMVLAMPLEASRQAALAEQLTAVLGGRVLLTVTVDPSLLGGAVIRYGDRVIDNSVKRRLERAVRTVFSNKKW